MTTWQHGSLAWKVVFLFWALAFGFVSNSQSAQTNLVRNPGFEEEASGKRSGQMPGWGVSGGKDTGEPAGSESLLDRATFHAGQQAAKLIGRQRPILLMQKIPLERGKRYRFGGWLKSRDVGRAELYYVTCVKTNGKHQLLDGGEGSIGTISGTRDWTYQEMIYTNREADLLELWLWLNEPRAESVAWFDDICVAELGENENPTACNLLRNSTFAFCTNPGRPDFWGVPSGQTWQFEDWGTGRYYGVDEKETSPVENTKVLKIVNSRADTSVSVNNSTYLKFPPLNDGPYVYSVYLKGDRPGLPVTVGYGAFGPGPQLAVFQVNEQWQRYEVTKNFSKYRKINAGFGLSQQTGTVWIAAPQVEEGTRATPYRPSLFDQGLTELATTSCVFAGPSVSCPIFTTRPVLDGALTDAVWQTAARLVDFSSVVSGAALTATTEGYVGKDAEHLYIGMRCQEPNMGQLAQSTTNRDEGAIFADDSVEIFLCPNPDSGDYVQLVANAAGAQYDSRLEEPNWDGVWECKTTKGDNEWTLEIAIPWASFPFERMGDAWRMNIGRNRCVGRTRETSSWSGTRDFHDPFRMGLLASLNAQALAPYCWSVRGPYLTQSEGQPDTLTMWLANPAGFTQEVAVALAGEGTDIIGHSQFTPSSALRPIQFVNVPAPVVGKRLKLTVCAANDKRILREQWLSVVAGKAVADAPGAGLTALLEYDYYTDDSVARLRVDWKGKQPATTAVTVRPTTGRDAPEMWRTNLVMEAARNRWIVLPIEKLPAGEYEVRVAVQATGRVVEEAMERLRKLPAVTGKMVRINKNTRSLSIAGESLLVTVCSTKGAIQEWQIKDIKAHGVNTLYLSFVGDRSLTVSNIAVVKGILDICRSNDLPVIFPVLSLPDIRMQKDKFINNFSLLKEIRQEAVAKLKDHPAIIAWFFDDEPRAGKWEGIYGYKEKDLKALYQAIKEIDPYRPALLNWCKVGFSYGSYDATDIASMDFYVSHYGYTRPLSRFAKWVEKINRDVAVRGQPVLFWMQAYGYQDQTRCPTPEEIRCEGYLNLIHGTRLLAYWEPRPYYPPTWEMIGKVNREAQELARRVFFAPDAREVIPAIRQDDVHYTLWVTDEAYWLIVANAGYRPAELVVDLGEYAGRVTIAATFLFEAGSISIEKGLLRDTLQPAQCRVYRCDR